MSSARDFEKKVSETSTPRSRARAAAVAGRLDAQMAHAGGGEGGQEGAVVAADLDHKGLVLGLQGLCEAVGELTEMPAHEGRGLGEEGVGAVEHGLARRLLDQLEEAAAAADGGRHLIEAFLGHLLGR